MMRRGSQFSAIIVCLLALAMLAPTVRAFQESESGASANTDSATNGSAAETPTEGTGTTLKNAPTATPNLLQQIFGNPLSIMVIALGLFYFMVLRPQQKKEKDKQREREEALSNMKKNFRVVTAGGIHGTVTASNSDTETVTIRIDESTGAKMTVNISSIVSIIDPNAKESSDN